MLGSNLAIDINAMVLAVSSPSLSNLLLINIFLLVIYFKIGFKFGKIMFKEYNIYTTFPEKKDRSPQNTNT